MRRTAGWILLTLVGLVMGCTAPQPVLSVRIVPDVGHVPFEAAILANAPPGTFTFELPGETIQQSSGRLEVRVDRLNWQATVTWTDGETVLVEPIEAHGNNALPLIYPPMINGIRDLWRLVPFDRTLISFHDSVYYDGTWSVTSIEVSGEIHGEFTVFYPPYTPGVCHAVYRGWLHEDACIVYPVYRSIETAGLPYSHTALDEGYPFLGWKNTNALYLELPSTSDSEQEIPEQSGTIVVAIRDDFGRTTTKSFTLPIAGIDYARPGDSL